MKLKKNIATSEEGFVFNPGSGDSFSANPVGTMIISLLKEDLPVEKIIATVCDKYDVEPDQFEKDLDDFKYQLADANLLEL